MVLKSCREQFVRQAAGFLEHIEANGSVLSHGLYDSSGMHLKSTPCYSFVTDTVEGIVPGAHLVRLGG